MLNSIVRRNRTTVPVDRYYTLLPAPYLASGVESYYKMLTYTIKDSFGICSIVISTDLLFLTYFWYP